MGKIRKEIFAYNQLIKNASPLSHSFVDKFLLESGLLYLIESDKDEDFLLYVWRIKGRLPFFRLKRKLKKIRLELNLPNRDYPKPKNL